jgi:CubicO group peptidase (beta-lactamase class C family)
MKKRRTCILFAGLAFAALTSIAVSQAASPVPQPPQQAAPASGTASDANKDKAAISDTRTYLQRLEKLGFAGVVLVAKGGAPLFAEGFGLADRERGLRWTPATVSCTGSITKQFTSAAILKFEEDKKLNVTDPITLYFKDVPADKAKITLHQLLSHSSGLDDPQGIDDYDPVPLADYVRQVLAQPLLFAPGTGYTYANANFSLLGAIIEKLSGMSYEAFVRERLFLPSGMYETGYILPQWGDGRMAQGYQAGKLWGTVLGHPMAADGPHWALRANGGIHSTAYDMLRWAQALLGGRVLSPESMKKLWAPHVSEGGNTFYGYGWSIAKAPDGTKIITHNGGNGIFFADFAIVPDAGLVVFLMTNVIAESRVANSLLGQVGMRFLGGQPYPSIPEIVDLDETALAALAGTYRLPGDGGGYSLTMDGKALFIEAEGPKAFSLLNSVREAEPGRFDKLNRLMDQIITGNRKGDFAPLFKAYGGVIPKERLKASWGERTKEIEEGRGRILRHEVLGTATTQDWDETVVRFYCEKGSADKTYVWDLKEEGRLRGMSLRGLSVRLRFYPSGERDFFTWDGGIRPPKLVHFETGPDGNLGFRLGDAKVLAVK